MFRAVPPGAAARSFAILIATVLAGLSSASFAAPVTTPSGLNPGDQYRLVFVTSTTRDAKSSDIADYNDFVTNAANSVAELAALGTTWSAIGSTLTIDARDNTGTNPGVSAGVPLYLLNDTLLASDNADLWDSNLLVPINIDETGAIATGMAWTGSVWDGKQYPAYYLDSPYSTAMGDVSATNWQWTNDSLGDPANSMRVYAISGIIPEPGTASLVSLGLITLATVRRHRR